MNNFEEKHPNLTELFITYLHQDWTIDGESLPELFENLIALQEMSADLAREISSLLSGGYSHEDLDYIFFNRWLTGYEPAEDDGETWIDVLHQLEELCRLHARQ